MRIDPAEPQSAVHFTLDPGELLLVTGENGAGKSALLGALLSMRGANGDANGARVEVFGLSPQRKGERAAALAQVGVLFQRNGLLRGITVKENVALPFQVNGGAGPDNAALAECVARRLALAGCGGMGARYPDGLGEGEGRCVALARALAGRTRVLLADEPTLGLSAARRASVLELLGDLLRGGALAAAVVFTQELALAGLPTTARLELFKRAGRYGLHRGVRRAGSPGAPLSPELS